MTRRVVVVSFLVLSGCATGQQLPPGAPTIAAIAVTWSQLASSGVPAPALLNIGVTLDDQACSAWFDQQVLGSEQTRFGQSALGLGGAGAAIAGGPASLAAAGALGLASSLLGSAQANSPAGADPVMAYGLMQRERQAWLASVPVPATTDIAWAYLNDYHAFCSLSSIRNALAQAVITTPVVVTPQPSPVVPPAPPPQPQPQPQPPSPSGGPIVTPNIASSRARALRHHTVTAPAVSFWERNPPTFALSPSLVAVPPRVCVGCGR